MYHNVDHVEHDPNLLSVTPERFGEQMAWLERRGLRGVGIAELVAAMGAGNQRGLVGLTFDDGYKGIVRNALPELAKRGFTATMFLIAGKLGGVNDWDEGSPWPLVAAPEVEALVAAGMEIGSHSMSHVHLAGASGMDLASEIAESRSAIAALTGIDVQGFCYPYGSMDATARAAVRAAGYRYACAVHTPPPQFSMFALPRVYVGQQDGARRLDAKRLLYRPSVAMKGRTS
jgi:peptidoglycan/xylan/chitin deacetylase (PgdA/CDA1 family)